MSVLKYFKNTPRSPPHRATGLKWIFFFKIAMRSLEKKKPSRPLGGRQGPVAQPTGDRPLGPAHGWQGGLSPTPRATGGACRPPAGDRGTLPYISIRPPFPPHLSTKIPPKIQKKREGWGEGKRRSPTGFSTCDLQVSTFNLNIVIFKYYVFKYE